MRRRFCVLALLLALAGTVMPVGPASAQTGSDPFGSLDAVWFAERTRWDGAALYGLSGWAADPDDDKSVPGKQVSVQVLVDGAPTNQLLPSTEPRPDVSAVHPSVIQPVGWSGSAIVPSDGRAHEVCAVARNTGTGSDVVLGCRRVVPGARDGHEPTDHVDVAIARPGLLHFAGWAGDPDPNRTRPKVELVLNGFVFDGWKADLARPDVEAARPDLPNAGGFDGEIAVPPGRYSWCVVARNVAPAGLSDTAIGCGVADVGGPSAEVRGAVDVVHDCCQQATGVSSSRVEGWAWDPVAQRAPDVRIHRVSASPYSSPVDVKVVTGPTVARPDVAAVVAGAPPVTGWSHLVGHVKYGGPIYACAFALIDGSEELIGCRGVTARG